MSANRREFLAAMAAVGSLPLTSRRQQTAAQGATSNTGRLKQGVTRMPFGRNPAWTYWTPGGQALEDACRSVAPLGVKGFDFILPSEWPVLRKHGLVCSLYRPSPPTPPVAGGSIGPPGWEQAGRKEAMGAYQTGMHEAIDVAAAAGVANILLLAGAVRSSALSSEQGADNTVAFCNAVKVHAEAKGVTLCLQLLNSRGGEMQLFDHMPWGVDVVKRVNSPRVRILYDIYHAQLMDGYIVQTIRDHIQLIAHFKTGGVPGRHEKLNDTQELNYRFIASAIADLKYTGFVTHDWTPSPGKDPIANLTETIRIMQV